MGETPAPMGMLGATCQKFSKKGNLARASKEKENGKEEKNLNHKHNILKPADFFAVE